LGLKVPHGYAPSSLRWGLDVGSSGDAQNVDLYYCLRFFGLSVA